MRRLIARIIFVAIFFFNCGDVIGQLPGAPVHASTQVNSDKKEELRFLSLKAKDVKLSTQFERPAVAFVL